MCLKICERWVPDTLYDRASLWPREVACLRALDAHESCLQVGAFVSKLDRPRPKLSLITDFETSIPLRMRFQAPQLGALGVTFTAFRAMQFLSLVAIIGMTANFINEIVSSQREAPDVLVGTLAVVCRTLHLILHSHHEAPR